MACSVPSERRYFLRLAVVQQMPWIEVTAQEWQSALTIARLPPGTRAFSNGGNAVGITSIRQATVQGFTPLGGLGEAPAHDE